jgi:quercetin dioxygenase-like cupin family protein
MAAAWNSLPPPRMVVTSHTKTGQSVFESDEKIAPFYPFGPQATGFARFHSRLVVPVNNTASPPPEIAQTLPKCPPRGLLFCTTDFPPNYSAPMHRTLTLDYAIVMSGEITLKLDGGEEKIVRAGEVIVQKGVNHQWINHSDQVCRMMCVMIASEKVVLEDGTVMEETIFGKK